MVLELKEYTMASLGYKSSENPLISANQTRPSPFTIKTSDSHLQNHSSSSFSFLFFTDSVFFLPPLLLDRRGGGQGWPDHRGQSSHPFHSNPSSPSFLILPPFLRRVLHPSGRQHGSDGLNRHKQVYFRVQVSSFIDFLFVSSKPKFWSSLYSSLSHPFSEFIRPPS